ncbi:hypothetical protein FS749_007700 [Ceratobasidium sp. UAMH 11750]|nr:hypothetical protein FS749_007700 [Ceratobasidium sp. UAMH 11750]
MDGFDNIRTEKPPRFTALPLDIGLCHTLPNTFDLLEARTNQSHIYTTAFSEEPSLLGFGVVGGPNVPPRFEVFENVWAKRANGKFWLQALETETGWLSYKLSKDVVKIKRTAISQLGPAKSWRRLRGSAKRLAETFKCDPKSLAIVLWIHATCKIICSHSCKYPYNNIRYVNDPDEFECSDIKRRSWSSLFYHRNSKSRDNPRKFWGFFSTLPDPHAPCPVFHAHGQRVEYKLSMLYLKLSDGYDFKYEQVVLDGLRKMPGSFGD